MAGIAQSVELPPINAAAMTNVAEDTVSMSHGPAKRGWFQTLVTFVWDQYVVLRRSWQSQLQ